MAEFGRVLQAAHAQYLKGVDKEVVQNSILLSMLKKRNKIKTGQSGHSLTWRLKTSQRELTPTGDMEAIQFARQNLYTTATLDWRGYVMQDAISQKERLMVRGPEAIIDIWAEKVEDMREDFLDRMNVELFRDGNATGNEERFHGLDSIFDGYTAGTTAYVASNESYAGLTLAATHGTESASTPYSPHLVNAKHEWDGSSTTFASQPIECVRALVSACSVGNKPSMRPDVCLTTESWYLTLLNDMQAEEQIAAKDSELTAIGFQAVQVDGVPVTWDYDCAASKMYCLNLNKIEIRLLSSQLADGETSYDHGRRAYLFSMGCWGNIKIHPRYQGLLKDFSS